MRCFHFTEFEIMVAMLNLNSLKYIGEEGYKKIKIVDKRFSTSWPFWNIEFTPPLRNTWDELDWNGSNVWKLINAYFGLLFFGWKKNR